MNWRAALVPLMAASTAFLCGLTWVGWTLAGEPALRPTIAVFLVSTPFAFLIAQCLPIWLVRRVGRASEITHVGIGALDAVPNLSKLVIDVDRTVTTGQMVVTKVQPLDPSDERTLKWFAGALAHLSSDPVNRAIARLSTVGRTTEFSEDPELGIRGSVDRHPVRVGRADWLDPSLISEQGATVAVEIDHRPFGHISVADEVRPDATRHLCELRRTGVEPVLVSGAGENDLARIAELAGAEEWLANTDAATQARRLGGIESGVGWTTVHTVESQADELESCEVELVLPGSPDFDTTLRTRDPSVGSVVSSLHLLRRARAARRLAAQESFLGVVVLTPVAAAGVIGPAVSAGLGAMVLALVALSTVLSVTRPGS